MTGLGQPVAALGDAAVRSDLQAVLLRPHTRERLTRGRPCVRYSSRAPSSVRAGQTRRNATTSPLYLQLDARHVRDDILQAGYSLAGVVIALLILLLLSAYALMRRHVLRAVGPGGRQTGFRGRGPCKGLISAATRTTRSARWCKPSQTPTLPSPRKAGAWNAASGMCWKWSKGSTTRCLCWTTRWRSVS